MRLIQANLLITQNLAKFCLCNAFGSVKIKEIRQFVAFKAFWIQISDVVVVNPPHPIHTHTYTHTLL